MKKLLSSLISSLFLVTFFSFSSHSQVLFDKHVIDNNFNGTAGIYAKDIDGDGKIDIIAAGDGGGIAWWRNNGGKPISWTRQKIDSNFSGAFSAFATDVDGDGNTDVLGTAWYDAEIAWWRNDGAEPINWTKQSIATNYTDAHEVYALDFDNDGDTDIFGVAAGLGDISWWRNDGSDPIAWTKQIIATNFGGARSAYVADFDGDGDNDVVGAAYAADRVNWWRNDDGDPIQWTEFTITDAFDGAHRVYACDMDRDGDQDILAAAYSASEIAWWRNDGGDPVVWQKQVIADNFNGALVAHAADFDGDGDTDVIGTASTGDEICWWENNGGDPFTWTKHTVDDQINGPWPIYAADVDGDGDMDIIAGADDSDLVLWWENLNTFLKPTFFAHPVTGHAPLTVQFKDSSLANPAIRTWQWDFNNDGTIDSNEQNPSWTFEQPGSYSVRLVVSSDSLTEEFIKEKYIQVFDGGSALMFDGNRSVVTCPATPSLNITDRMTLEAWINPVGWGSLGNLGFGRIIDKDKFSLLLVGQSGSYNPNSLALWLVTAAGSPGFINSEQNSIKLNQWQHVAATYDGSSGAVKIYINGVEQSIKIVSGQFSGNIRDNSALELRMGNSANRLAFAGAIDEVRIWNVVRSATDILTHKDHYLQGNEPGLAGYWRLDEGNGNNASDGSGHNNAGTIDHASWVQGINLAAPTPINKQADLPQISPSSFSLDQNCPNPFNSTTRIAFNLPRPVTLSLNIYDINGRLVKSLAKQEKFGAGHHSIAWNGSNNDGTTVSSGVYFYLIESKEFNSTKKLILLK